MQDPSLLRLRRLREDIRLHQIQPSFDALDNQGVEAAYMALLRDIFNGATSTLKLHVDSSMIKLKRGVRPGRKTINKSRACLGAQLTICAQK